MGVSFNATMGIFVTPMQKNIGAHTQTIGTSREGTNLGPLILMNYRIGQTSEHDWSAVLWVQEHQHCRRVLVMWGQV